MSERLLTYRQIADEFGLSPQAVRKRVHRMGLRKVPSNDGKVRVAIPDGMVFQASRDHEDGQEDGQVSVREDGLVDALRQQIRVLQGDMMEERTARLAAETRAARAEGEVQGLRTAIETAEAARRDAEARAEESREAQRILEIQAGRDADALAEAEGVHVAALAEAEAAGIERDMARREAEAVQEALAAFQARPWWRRITGF